VPSAKSEVAATHPEDKIPTVTSAATWQHPQYVIIRFIRQEIEYRVTD